MNNFSNEIKVLLGAGRAYSVHIGPGAAQTAAAFAPPPAMIVSNPTVWKLHGEKLARLLPRAAHFLIGDGEQYKTMRTVEDILTALAKSGLRRDSVVVAFGGGVVGDSAGFAAAVYMRGLSLLHIPTTLLAQTDAAIGGKTGVNHPSGKNLIGAFHQPRAVLCDTDFLSTLPPRDYRAGLAEVVKYGLLGDADFFAWLEDNSRAVMAMEQSAVQTLVAASVRMKAEIVAADEYETGRRALLNLGHTFAHAVETTLGYGDWTHGEAVAAGLVAAAKLSQKICDFPAADCERIVRLLQQFKLPTAFPTVAPEELRRVMRLDKKHRAAGENFVVMPKLGAAKTVALGGESDEKIIMQTLDSMQ